MRDRIEVESKIGEVFLKKRLRCLRRKEKEPLFLS